MNRKRVLFLIVLALLVISIIAGAVSHKRNKYPDDEDEGITTICLWPKEPEEEDTWNRVIYSEEDVHSFLTEDTDGRRIYQSPQDDYLLSLPQLGAYSISFFDYVLDPAHRNEQLYITFDDEDESSLDVYITSRTSDPNMEDLAEENAEYLTQFPNCMIYKHRFEKKKPTRNYITYCRKDLREGLVYYTQITVPEQSAQQHETDILACLYSLSVGQDKNRYYESSSNQTLQKEEVS